MGKRKKFAFVPSFEDPILIGWTINYISKNLWKVSHIFEFADLMQEAYLKFHACQMKYPYVVEPKHFLSLYKRAFINRFYELVVEGAVQSKGCSFEQGEEEYGSAFSRMFMEDPLQEFCVRVMELSSESLELLIALESGQLAELKSRRFGQKRETTNDRFRRALGHTKKVDYTKELKSLIDGE